MDRVDIAQAQNDLFRIMDSVLKGGKTIITSEKGDAVLLSKEEWDEIAETVYVLSDPDTYAAVMEARNTPTSKLETVDWRNIF